LFKNWKNQNPDSNGIEAKKNGIEKKENIDTKLMGASPGSIYYTAKMFFTSKFSYYFFYPKTETGTANRLGSTNSKPPGPIIMICQSEILSRSQIIFVTLFSAGAQGS
jgi:hypothetical protein